MRRWLTSTALAIVMSQLGMAASIAPAAAASVADQNAEIEAMKRELAALREENRALRAKQQQPALRNVPVAAAPAQPALRAGSAVDPGPYAADLRAMPTKAPIPVARGSWTGFYLGPNIGLSIGHGDTTRGSAFSNGGNFIADRFTMSPLGVVGGGQIGFNWQAMPNWVLGVEADLQGSGESDTVCVFQCTTSIAGFNRSTVIEQKLDWFGTVRGRFGWTNGPALIYATGGLAYGHATTDVALNDFNFGVAINQSAHVEKTKIGWTAGFGAETQLFGNWTGKVEYLYVDLGTVASGGFVSVFTPTVSQTHTFTSELQDHIVRFGLNYKFGEPVYASAVGGAYGLFTKAPPLDPYTWTGAYVGANLGIGVARNDTTTPLSIFGPGSALPVGVFDSEQFKLGPLGAVGGGQAGYNWQATRNWVLGIETDFQGTSQEATACMNCGPIVGGGVVGAIGTTLTQRIDWFGTLRGRVGWADGPVLYYATAGLAYGHVSTDERDDTVPFLTAVTTTASFGQTKAGWTAGGGAEAHLYGNWTAKAEYLYLDLGDVSGSLVAPRTVIPLNVNPAGINVSENRGFNSSVHDHIFRLGVNYKVMP